MTSEYFGMFGMHTKNDWYACFSLGYTLKCVFGVHVYTLGYT